MNDVSDSCIQWQHACASTSLCTLKITLWICSCVVLSLTKIKAACSTSSPEECCIFSLMQWQSHTVDNVFQNNIPEGYTGRKRSLDCADWGLAWKASKLRKRGWRRRKKKPNSPKSSSLCVALYICLSFWSCFSIFLFASLCAFSSFLWSSVLLLPKQPIFPQEKGGKKGVQGMRKRRRWIGNKKKVEVGAV